MKSLLALLCLFGLTVNTTALAGEKQDERARNAVAVLDKVMLVPEQSIPESMLRDAQAVAVIPGVVKAGLVVGGRFGRGLVSVRQADGTWSNPSFISIAGGSFGFQFGVTSTDVVLVFRTRRG
ncbi:MAG: lipid-binding SYLF domain-containing protein, partial [Xanthomonadaceae bacterium]|nr:lipid-binding SYLF domain-containing protein [Xanthomonadaceae bacterium]